MKKVLVLAALLAALAVPAAAADDCYDGMCEVGWNTNPPSDDPIWDAIGGNVAGGDGASCEQEIIDCVANPDNDFGVSPCAIEECFGDDGRSVTCDWVCILVSYTPPPPVEYVTCPGADDPAYDPNDPECW